MWGLLASCAVDVVHIKKGPKRGGERPALDTTDLDSLWHRQWLLSETSRVLLEAARTGDTPEVARSLDGLAKPDCCDTAGLTPLHAAAGRGFAEIVRLLLDKRATPDAPGGPLFNGPPSCLAASRGHADCLQLLVEADAHLEARGGESNWTPLHFACAEGHPKCARVIMDGCPHTTKVHENRYGEHHVHEPLDLIANMRDSRGRLALHEAALRQNPACVDMLIKGGFPSHDERDAAGDGALHLAASGPVEDAGTVVCELLIASKASPNLAAANGETALHIAARLGRPRMCTVLLVHGADPGAAEASQRFNPLHLAAQKGSTTACAALLEGRADPHLVDARKNTPLMVSQSLECSAVLCGAMRVNERNGYAVTDADGGGELAH